MTEVTSSVRDIERIRRLNAIGIALSAERDQARLLEMILNSARDLTGADAGTFYLYEPEAKALHFAIVQNDSLNIHLGGTGEPVGNRFPVLPLYQADGTPNEKMVVAYAVLHDKTVNVRDAYTEQGFDFAGTKAFDQRTGYRSCSFLAIPLRNHEGETMAVLQLINKLDETGKAIAFDSTDQEIAESLASQAAIALTNQRLIAELRNLFDSFVQVIASAIDAKSPHTGAHCRRVPEATLMLAEAASQSDLPGLADFALQEADRYELTTAAWLHDCGKVTTPHHVMEKSTKLEAFIDRIDMVALRIEILCRDLEIAHLQRCVQAAQQGLPLPDETPLQHEMAQLAADFAFLQRSNKGGEFMRDEDLARLQQIAARCWVNMAGDCLTALTEDELMNLSIRKGTLNAEERKIMEGHMVMTISMLEQLPFPKHLRRVPEYACGHHERMDGRGYPRGLTREQMSVPARIMGIADVFEALTAHERPYKKPMPLSMALTIMGRMVEDQHLDPELFAVFVGEKVYLQYAEKYLQPEQIDEVDLNNLPGLQALWQKTIRNDDEN
ncbi:GAF and HD-GYP domain-containing protein [Aquaspirillum serpens]|uniref:GAF and HD-GYP domain-containing protein n=1 Tax=Aquaspirillum serpens TaxID=190 RepID=UPI0003B5B1B5|nr:HD family phosphohydrolase [Aquaspirillum serpens]